MESQRRVSEDKKLRLRLRRQVNWGRTALLVIIGVTLLNQILLMLNINYHFLFSAAAPYYLNWLSKTLGAQTDLGAFPFFATLLTLLFYGAYVVCWLFSGQRREWLMAALGLYAIDTLLLIIFAFTLLENPMSCFFEIVFHGAGIWLLFSAMRAAERLSRMPKRRRVPSEQREQAGV